MSQTSDAFAAGILGQPSIGRVALVWRGDSTAEPPAPSSTRFHLIFASLNDVGLAAEPVLFSEEAEDAVRARLLAVDGVLVWVDPLSSGKDRSRLDSLLRNVAARGIWVSAHPDVILKMGVKEVLYRTRKLSWSADTDLYQSVDDFTRRFPKRLATGGARVIKQNRGNGGQGLWKVELISDVGPHPEPNAPVPVLHALRGSVPEDLSLGAFMQRCRPYFAGDGRIIDQAFQPRLPEGMIRCYLSQNHVVGYGHQLIKALVAPQPGEGPEAVQPGPRIMHPAHAPPFQNLRKQIETQWVPAMQALHKIAAGAVGRRLPVRAKGRGWMR